MLLQAAACQEALKLEKDEHRAREMLVIVHIMDDKPSEAMMARCCFPTWPCPASKALMKPVQEHDWLGVPYIG